MRRPDRRAELRLGQSWIASGLTLLIPPQYFDRVIRFFLAMLCALGLAFNPAAINGAIATPAAMQGCTMDGHMPAKPAEHSKMDCCTPACQISAAVALLPQRTSDGTPLKRNGALHDASAVKRLASLAVTGLDPPPRTTVS